MKYTQFQRIYGNLTLDSDCVFCLLLLLPDLFPQVWRVATFCGLLFTIAVVLFSPLNMVAATSKSRAGMNCVI